MKYVHKERKGGRENQNSTDFTITKDILKIVTIDKCCPDPKTRVNTCCSKMRICLHIPVLSVYIQKYAVGKIATD